MNWDELFAYVQANPAQTQDIFSRLSDEERKEYLAAANRWMENQPNKERNRQDNTLMGGPPELAAVGAAGLAKGGFRGIMDSILGRKRLSGQHPLTNEIDPALKGKAVPKPTNPKPVARKTPAERSEFPPGTSSKTKPDDFQAARRKETEKIYGDKKAVGATRRKIAEKLDKK